MKKLLLLLCIPFVGIAQTDYELEFNSATQDYVQMPNTSAVIANKTAFSMSCWVYPEANTNHGGIIGFRNNTDADFYLLQLQNTNNIEARFRNSSGINYDIVAANALDFNQWQHLSFTYDGSYIRLYKNGIIIDSTAANGTITQNTASFMLGALDWQGSLFCLNGRLDEIRLWDVSLSQTEINNWLCVPVDLTHPHYNNLMGYWRLNDGNGTIAPDQSINNNHGTLYNSVMWQIASNCLGTTASCFISGNDTICDNSGDLATINIDFLGVPPFAFQYAIDGISQPLITTSLNPYIIQTNQPGVYTIVSFSDANGSGLVSGSAFITVVLSPIASFSALPDTLPVTFPQTQFIDQSVYNINSWIWDFGDGTTSIQQDPYHTYPSINNLYTIGLIVTDINGCSDTAFGYVLVTSQTGIQEYIESNKLLKIINILGRESKGTKNEPFFYIYDDGTVEKHIIIE